jgi:hypothetical protein
MENFQSLAKRAYAPYGGMASPDVCMYRVDTEPHVMSRDRVLTL